MQLIRVRKNPTRRRPIRVGLGLGLRVTSDRLASACKQYMSEACLAEG